MDDNELKKVLDSNIQEEINEKANKKRIKIRLVHFIILALIIVIVILGIVVFSMVKYVFGTMSLYMKYKNYNEGLTDAIELLGKDEELEQAKDIQEQANSKKYIVEIDRSIRKNGVEERKKLETKGNVDIDDELIQDLYKTKLLKSNSIAYDYEGSFYKNSKTTIENLSNEEKNIAILQYLEWQEKEYTEVNSLEENVLKELLKISTSEFAEINPSDVIFNLKVFSKDEIKKAMIEVFGKEINIDFEDFHGCAEDFIYIDDKYYFYNFPGGGYGDLTCGIGQIQYVVKEKDYIYIYDKYAFRRDMNFEVQYKDKVVDTLNSYYASSEDEQPIGIQGINVIANYTEGTDAEIYELYNRLHLYKHTFKKGENDSYYWVSTEIEK